MRDEAINLKLVRNSVSTIAILITRHVTESLSQLSVLKSLEINDELRRCFMILYPVININAAADTR